MDDVQKKIIALRSELKNVEHTREIACALTKLDECELWYGQDLKNKEFKNV